MEFSRSFMSVHSHFHEISPSTRNSQLNCISHFFPIYKKFDLQKILNWLHHTVVYSCLLGELLEGHKFFPNFFPMSTLFFFEERVFSNKHTNILKILPHLISSPLSPVLKRRTSGGSGPGGEGAFWFKKFDEKIVIW